jgi:hypothetical protein
MLSLLSLALLSFTLIGIIPTAAALTTSTNCATPSVPGGSLAPLNSTFTLTIIGSTGQVVTLNQNTLLSLAACTSFGGFVSHGTPTAQNYGNYTGVPVLTLINLVGGITSGETVTATSGTDGYQTSYTYSEVTAGTGWGNIYTTTSLTTAVTTPPSMYLVLAYLWNGKPISPYACASTPTPCPNGPTTSGVGPLRTVTVTSSSGYLISAGGPWNKGLTTIQVNPPEVTVQQALTSATGTVGGGVIGSSVVSSSSISGISQLVAFTTASGGAVGFEVPSGAAGLVTYQITSSTGLLVGYTQLPLVGLSSMQALYTKMGDTLTAV